MKQPKDSLFRPTDDQARALARTLMADARTCALAVMDAQSGGPMVTRAAFALDRSGRPIALVSTLAAHTQALMQNPLCSLLVGEPGPKGDPLNAPRLTLMATARFVAHDSQEYREMSGRYLETHPKAKLYIGFGDFLFAVFDVTRAHLNGGFGKAYQLTPADLGL
jgi:putative heme iron utilization protein